MASPLFRTSGQRVSGLCLISPNRTWNEICPQPGTSYKVQVAVENGESQLVSPNQGTRYLPYAFQSPQTPRRAPSPCAASAFVRQTSCRSLQRPSENKGSGVHARQLSENPSLDEQLLLSSGQGTVVAETQYVPNIPYAVTSALGDTAET